MEQPTDRGQRDIRLLCRFRGFPVRATAGATLCTRSVRRGRRRTDLVHKVTDRDDGWQPDGRTGRPDIPSACGFSLGTPGENPAVAGISPQIRGVNPSNDSRRRLAAGAERSGRGGADRTGPAGPDAQGRDRQLQGLTAEVSTPQMTPGRRQAAGAGRSGRRPDMSFAWRDCF